jgi:lipopolysaccharide/colanic/teichoic acid biosynthesis glycosyltransferase
MDIFLSIVIGVFAILMYPFVFLAIKLEDGGPVLISQGRVGRNNKTITLYKFRSMKDSDGGKWLTENDKRHTTVGKFLRRSRIDEFPQLWNVLRGDISLIGPRPDILNLGLELAKEIPYYNIRNIIKPGLSGWAQIHQDKPPQSVAETKLRLAYDLYYIKNRSFLLDLKIAARTLKTLLVRAGM